MVSVTIYMEGGVLPHANIPAATINNSNRLREGFNKLFRQIFAVEDFDLKIEMGSGEKQAAVFFKESIKRGEAAVLLLDVYKHKGKISKLEEFGLANNSQQVFFMVREMEAWILSQLDVLEKFGTLENLIRQKPTIALKEDKSLQGIAIKDIDKPSDTLKVLLGRYYKNRRGKKQKYGKLKNAPAMIELLDIKSLRDSFEDVENLILYIQRKKEIN
ncbi:DUF4276 family protein [Aureispira anguillae]|uniref:DUF4276 family protein n=1 Tax=Aureispira anguillae TaxID=2864201 RepID=A0A915YF87_9BACT|nr:DUF4276 family protein [Aureispira anguillae]BDS11913.1 DUF4276 family protein [Aureispira anguillae]